MGEVLSARSISKRFGDVAALSDVSFAFDGPQVIGILGPNGAGKTTLLDILLGLSEPDSGEVRLFGKPITRYPRRDVGVVLQKEFILDHATVREYAALFAAIYDVPNGQERILRQAALIERASAPLGRISGGEAARLFLAAASVHDPKLLLLDEPTAHLDAENKRRIGAELREMSRRCTVVLTTHDLREADALCDQLLFLVQGTVRAAGSREELVSAVPAEQRTGLGVEDAFFHFCSIRMHRGEATEAPGEAPVEP